MAVPAPVFVSLVIEKASAVPPEEAPNAGFESTRVARIVLNDRPVEILRSPGPFTSIRAVTASTAALRPAVLRVIPIKLPCFTQVRGLFYPMGVGKTLPNTSSNPPAIALR